MKKKKKKGRKKKKDRTGAVLPNSVVKSFHPFCRGCGSSMDLSEVIDELFLRLARKLLDGERVTLPHIGTFQPQSRPGRWLPKIHDRQRGWVPRYRQVGFRSCNELRLALNADRPCDEPDDRPQESNDSGDNGQPTIPAATEPKQQPKKRAKRRRYGARPGKAAS